MEYILNSPSYASNEPKSMLARDLGDCRDNHEKLAKRVSYGYIYCGFKASERMWSDGKGLLQKIQQSRLSGCAFAVYGGVL